MSLALLPPPLFLTPPAPVRRFSVAEYLGLFAKGVLDEDEKVELLDGWIIPRMTHSPQHDCFLSLVDHALRSLIPPNWHLRLRCALLLPSSVPEPDRAVVAGNIRTYFAQRPTHADAALVIEVADSSLDHDRHVKGPIYANAGIAVYWIANVPDNTIEVYTSPSPTGYQHRQDYAPGDAVPLVIAGAVVASVPAADLLA